MRIYKTIWQTRKKYFLLAVICVLLLFAVRPPAYAVEYEIVNIPAQPWWTLYPSDINNRGEVVGLLEWYIHWSIFPIIGINKVFLYSYDTYTELWPMSRLNTLLGVHDYRVLINDSGTVAGSITMSPMDNGEGFIYKDGRYKMFLPPQWKSVYEVTAINEKDAIIGSGIDGIGTQNGFMYHEGTYTELLPPGWINAYAHALNNDGTVVGNGSDSTGTQKGFLYSEGIYTELLPPGWQWAQVVTINERGSVIGLGNTSIDLPGTKGFIYSEGTYTEIIPSECEESNLKDINDCDAVIGTGWCGLLEKGFMYHEGSYTELDISPIAINNDGTVVGSSSTDKVYVYSKGTYTELSSPEWSKLFPIDLNNTGTVLGQGWYNNGQKIVIRGFIAVPK
jgi:probable HAF family extracellular repeat protein